MTIIPTDKLLHALCGAIVLALFLPLGSDIAASVLLAVAIGKECLDWLLNLLAKRKGKPPPHGVEAMDAVATIWGGIAFLMLQDAVMAAWNFLR